MKIAVIARDRLDFEEYVRRTGVDPKYVNMFHPVYRDYDVAGHVFTFVLYTYFAERQAGFWPLHRLCISRVYKPPEDLGGLIKFDSRGA